MYIWTSSVLPEALNSYKPAVCSQLKEVMANYEIHSVKRLTKDRICEKFNIAVQKIRGDNLLLKLFIIQKRKICKTLKLTYDNH